MKEQNFKNHTQYVPGYHGFTALAILALLVGSIRHLIVANDTERYNASLIVLVAVILVCLFWYTRAFALKAQDRAIRVEENLRHFMLTGKSMDHRIRMAQIIALRFASDDELPALAQRAAETSMTSADIKMAIKNWKADHYRV